MSLTTTKKHDVLDRLGGDEELLQEIVQMYLEDYPVLLGQLETAIEKNNSAMVTRAAHDLKGLLSNFSPTQATSSVQSLEQSFRMNDQGNTPDRLAALRHELESLSALLREWTSQSERRM